MTLVQLRTLVLSWLDDPNAGYFTPAQVNVWINNGMKEVQKKLVQSGELWWAIEYTVPTIVNTAAYAVPTDFLRMHKLNLVVSGTAPNETLVRLVPITPVQADNFPQGTGQPSAYWLRKNSIVVAIIPNSVWTLRFLYTAQIAALSSDSDVPDMPDRYQEAIALEACMDGFLKDQRDPNPMFKMKWDNYMKMLEQDAQDRTVDEPREVVITQFDNTFYWGM